jgi:hypothetical protein
MTLILSDESPTQKSRLEICVLILDKIFLRSWLEENQVQELQTEFDVTVLIPDDIENSYQIPGVNLVTYSKIKTGRLERYLMTIYWIANLSKSKSFRFNLERYILGNINWGYSLRSDLKIIKRICGFVVLKPYHFLFFIEKIRRVSQSSITCHLTKKINDLQSVFTTKYDVVLIPSSGGETELYIILEHLHKNRVTSVLCVDNWDNIYGKVALTTLPDFLTVMGNSSKAAATSIHGFHPRNVAPIGIPRFDHYRKLHNITGVQQASEQFTILYLGFSLEHDEVHVINELFRVLSRANDEFRFEILYRPHPRRLKRAREVELNPSIKISKSIELASTSKSGMPTMDATFYDEILNASVVIGAPTTMVLEAMALGKPCILDISDDGIHRTTSSKSFHKFSHMQELENIPELRIAKSIGEVIDHVITIHQDKTQEVKFSLEHIVNLEPSSYFNQLSEFLAQLEALGHLE